MLFTTANGSYIAPPNTWKGKAQRATVPAWSRPYRNAVPGDTEAPEVVLGPARKPNPQKTWRKQLAPRAVTGIGAASYNIQFDQPGANVYLGVDSNGDPLCCGDDPTGFVTKDVPKNRDPHDDPPYKVDENDPTPWTVGGVPGADALNDLYSTDRFKAGQHISLDDMNFLRQKFDNLLIANNAPTALNDSSTSNTKWLDTFNRWFPTSEVGKTKPAPFNIPLAEAIARENQGRKFCCNPEANVIKSAMTTVPINPVYDKETGEKINKSYSFSTAEYLRSKTRSYKQNLSGAKIDGVDYAKKSDNGCCTVPLPYDEKNAERNALNCPPETCDGKGRKIIIKPNNQQYFQQGAVSSSSRIERLKYNTVTKNANSFNSAFGAAAANAGRYRADGNGPYFIKSKTQQPQCPKPRYAPYAFTLCWITNPSDTHRQNKTNDIVYQRQTK